MAIAGYRLLATMTAVWVTRDLPIEFAVGAFVISASVAASASAYSWRLAMDH